MRILVVSDVHAFSVKPSTGTIPSYVQAGDTSADSPTNQFIALMRQGKIPRPDVVVCPGDLCHQADAPGLESAWRFLKDVVDESPGATLVATVGNHDLDSRLLGNDYDPKGKLLTLNPSYPLVDASDSSMSTQSQLMFWAKNFCIFTKNDVRFVLLNSSAFHGYGKEGATKEYEHGRISAYTLSSLEQELLLDATQRAGRGDPPISMNVLICHHHLEPDAVIDEGDGGVMLGASALIEFMQRTEIGRWLVIHGHRHRARLFQRGGAPPVRFSVMA